MKRLPKNIKRNLVIGLTLSIVFSVVGIAAAQEIQRSYTVINPQIEIKLDPGLNTEGTTKVINETNSPLTFNLSVQDYIVVDTNGTPNLLPPNTLNNKYSAASWIVVTPSVFTLKPREKQTINYYIHIPKDARPGGHYAGIVYSPVSEGQTAATGGTVKTQIGSLFYITVKGPIKESAIVSKFLANTFQEYGPVNILTQIKNNGDLHIKPQGSITVSGLFGSKSYKFPEANIFPETARDFQNIVGQTLMIGRYKAVLLASYGVNNNLPLTSTLYFWVFPWRLVLIIFLLIVALILLIVYLRKRKKKDQKEPEEPTRSASTNIAGGPKTEAPVTTESKTPETPKKTE